MFMRIALTMDCGRGGRTFANSHALLFAFELIFIALFKFRDKLSVVLKSVMVGTPLRRRPNSLRSR